MILFRTVAAALLLTSTAAFAQDAPVAPAGAPEPAPAAGAPAPAAASGGPPAMAAVRTTCRSEMDTKGIRGPARRQAMMDCMTQARPDMAPRIKCWGDPNLKGMDKDAKRAAVRDCMMKARG